MNEFYQRSSPIFPREVKVEMRFPAHFLAWVRNYRRRDAVRGHHIGGDDGDAPRSGRAPVRVFASRRVVSRSATEAAGTQEDCAEGCMTRPSQFTILTYPPIVQRNLHSHKSFVKLVLRIDATANSIRWTREISPNAVCLNFMVDLLMTCPSIGRGNAPCAFTGSVTFPSTLISYL